MCGPSGQEKSLESQESSLFQMLNADFQTRFAGQTQTLQGLNESLGNLEQGNIPQGFNSADLAALNTQAINETGKNYANAARAVGGQLAGRGGDSGLESGVDQQIKAGLASSAAGQLSGEQNQIAQANFNTGRADLLNAIGGKEALAGLQNPQSFAGLANTANQNAFGEANTINQENNQETADIAGLAVGAGIDAATFGAGAAGGGFTGGINALNGFPA